jgi:CBS domain-containing protein
MKVTEIMTHLVQTLEPTAPVKNAAVLMREYDIGDVLVCDDGRLEGILTDRDIVIRALAQSGNLENISVGEIMSRRPVCCEMDDTINQAAAIMEEHQVRRLPVRDASGRVAGIVSLGDIATHAHNERLSAMLIEQVSQREHGFLAPSA